MSVEDRHLSPDQGQRQGNKGALEEHFVDNDQGREITRTGDTKKRDEITFSVVSKDKGILTKIIRLKSGRVVKDASECRMANGVIETVTSSMGEFGELLRRLRPNQALVHGVSQYPRARVLAKGSYSEMQDAGSESGPTVTRTREHIVYTQGPGLLLLDHDKARDNAVVIEDEALQLFTPQELVSVLVEICPGIAEAAWVSTPSTSSCIFDKDGNELRGEGSGAHIYLFPQDATDVPRFLQVFGKRLILAGYGRVEISRSGALLTRTLVDLSVGSPERLDFVAGAICEDGLKQRLPEPQLHPGHLFDTRSLLDLTKAEEQKYESILQDLKERAKPAQDSVRGTYIEQEAAKLAEVKSIDMDTAREIVRTRQDHVLSDDDLLYFARHNGKPISVAEVLEVGEGFHEQSLADPLEPDYDGGHLAKAKFYWNGGNPKIHSFAHGSVTYTFKRFRDDLEEQLSDLMERTKSDCGAPFEPESLRMLARLKQRDKSRFMQVRSEVKRINGDVLLKELDRDVDRYYVSDKIDGIKSSSSTLSDSYSSRDPSLRDIVIHFQGALVSQGEKGINLVSQSDAASKIAEELKGHFAFDIQGLRWHRFEQTIWRECSAHEFDSAVTDLLYSGTGALGFSNNYESGIVTLLQKGGRLRLPPFFKDKIPFQNGLLDVSTGQLETVTPDNAATWVLPYDYDKEAHCPNFIEWLIKAVENDDETIQLLRAWINALLTGRPDLQVFLHLVGPAGTGKSTFGRLAFILVGSENATTTSLKQLETNRFETANIYEKRLVAIEEADKYGGSVNILKAMTGQDPLRLERKHVQQQESFIYTGQTLMMSNESLASSDYTSGIERRRVTVEFKRRFTREEHSEWIKRGGEAELLHREAPGIVNWALGLTRDQVTGIFKGMPERIRRANLAAARYNNPILDWMLQCLIPDENAATQVGDKRESRENGEVIFDKASERLYPNYLTWCQRSGHKAVALQRFTAALIDASASHGVTITKKRESDGTKVTGLRIRSDGEEAWLGIVERGCSVHETMKDNRLNMLKMSAMNQFGEPAPENQTPYPADDGGYEDGQYTEVEI